MPKLFEHDCDNCKFLGSWVGHDVYICKTRHHGTSIIARSGDDGPDYSSLQLEHFWDLIRNNVIMGIKGQPNMKFQEYLFSQYCTPANKAMVLGLLNLQLSNNRAADFEEWLNNTDAGAD